jgi:hypothetical protein
MGLLDQLFGRPALAASVTHEAISVAPGPTTAHQAWAHARPRAEAFDAKARLVLVTSGTDLRPDGRSSRWEFLFELPSRQATLLASLAPPDDGDPDTAPARLTLRVQPAPGRAPGPALPSRFRDSPDVVAEFAANGVDFVAGPSDMKLEARVLGAGPAWITWTWDGERHAAFSLDS